MASDVLKEKVPRLRRRGGDMVLANENNASIVLGRDRDGGVDSGYGSQAGTAAVQVMVGRKSEDPSFSDDPASLYLSAKTDPDSVAGTDVGTPRRGVSGMMLRADCVRIAPRTDFKVSVGRATMVMYSDGRIVLDGDISLGEGAAEHLIKGESFAAIWASHFHTLPPLGPTAVSGPPTLPLPPSVYTTVSRGR